VAQGRPARHLAGLPQAHEGKAKLNLPLLRVVVPATPLLSLLLVDFSFTV
jgi:hypothetical protein